MSRPTSPTAAMVSTGAVSTVNGIVSTNYVSNSVDSQRLVRHDGNQVRLPCVHRKGMSQSVLGVDGVFICGDTGVPIGLMNNTRRGCMQGRWIHASFSQLAMIAPNTRRCTRSTQNIMATKNAEWEPRRYRGARPALAHPTVDAQCALACTYEYPWCGNAQVVEAKPVSFYREYEPNKYLNAPDVEAVPVQIIDKPVERLVEVLQLQPVEKVVDRAVETLDIQDQQNVNDIQLQLTVPHIVEVEKPVYFDREVLKENIQEVYVDKVVERVVEVLRERCALKAATQRLYTCIHGFSFLFGNIGSDVYTNVSGV